MRDRDELVVKIRRYPHSNWGVQPRRDGSWECFFEIPSPGGPQRLHAFGQSEADALEKMLEILRREISAEPSGERT